MNETFIGFPDFLRCIVMRCPIRPGVRRKLISATLFIVGGLLYEVSIAAEDNVNLEVHEWSVWIAEPHGKQINGAADYPTAMPGLVDSERSRKRDSGKQKPAPVSLMTIYGTPPDVVDVDLKITAGRPISQWPRSEGKANRLRWMDLTLSKELTNQELIAYIPETHWFRQARELDGLYIQLKKGGRAERFFAYDLELNSTLNIRIDGGPDQYKIANLGKQAIHDVLLILPGTDGVRLGWVDIVSPTPNAAATGSENKPPATPAAQAQPAAQPTVAVAGAPGAAVVLANPLEAPATKPAGAENQKPDATAAPAKPPVKDLLVEIPLTAPIAIDSDEFKQKTDVELRRRLGTTGLNAKEIDLMMSLYAKHFFATDDIQVVYRMSQAGIDELTPLTIEPDTAKVKRVAMVIAKKVDPRLRDDVQKLVGELADVSYAKREQAEKRLRELGNLAIPSLKEAMKSKDLEVVMRAERILLGHKEQLGNDPAAAQ